MPQHRDHQPWRIAERARMADLLRRLHTQAFVLDIRDALPSPTTFPGSA